MILSICLYAINLKAFLLVFRLRNSVCHQVPYNLFAKWYKDTRKKIVLVQVLGAPFPGIRNEGNSFPNPGWKAGSGYLAFFG